MDRWWMQEEMNYIRKYADFEMIFIALFDLKFKMNNVQHIITILSANSI